MINNKILIFGGGGFVGSDLAEQLYDMNYEVFVFDIKNNVKKNMYSFNRIDITNKNELDNLDIKFFKGSIIVNLAARQYNQKIPLFSKANWFEKVNYYGAINIINFGIKIKSSGIIQLSTDMVYGIKENEIIDEKTKYNPIGPYGVSKMKMEILAKKICNDNSIKLNIIRPCMIVGKGRLGLLKTLFFLIKFNLPVPIIGNGKNIFPMIDVKDCSKSIIQSIQAKIPNTSINISSNYNYTFNNLIKNIIKKTKSKSIIVNINSNFFFLFLKILSLFGLNLMYKEQYLIADKTKIYNLRLANDVLNWKPSSNINESLFENYKNWVKK